MTIEQVTLINHYPAGSFFVPTIQNKLILVPFAAFEKGYKWSSQLADKNKEISGDVH